MAAQKGCLYFCTKRSNDHALWGGKHGEEEMIIGLETDGHHSMNASAHEDMRLIVNLYSTISMWD
jgi:hypothetical protein